MKTQLSRFARRLAPLMLVAAFVPRAHAQPATAKPDTAQVLAAVVKLFDGMRTRDTASMRALFHPGASLNTTSVRDGTPVVGTSPIDAWISSVGRARAGLVLDERLMNTKVLVEDGLATVWTEYELWVGDRFSHCGVDAMILGRTAEGWKFLTIADTRKQDGCKQTPSR